jgi:CheY-like chemotaxis protein
VTAARVLVVDDEQQILRALRTSLKGAGYDVDTAETAEGALTAAALRPPDAVILDLVLPDGSGIDVCRQLRSWSSAPVIVLSAVGRSARRSPRSTRARTTTSRSPSASTSCSRACGRRCGGRRRRRSR